MAHRLIQLRLQALAAPVDVRRICCRRGAGRSAGFSRSKRAAPIARDAATASRPTGV